jgi:hypothetical protein
VPDEKHLATWGARYRPGSPDYASTDLHEKTNFLKPIKLFLSVQSRLKKYSGFPKAQITFISPLSRPTRGALAIVTDAGRDAVDASGASDESAFLADGEVVWS